MAAQPTIAMNATPAAISPLVELEARHDEALRQLAELELRIEAVLKDAMPASALWPPESVNVPQALSGPVASSPVDQTLDMSN